MFGNGSLGHHFLVNQTVSTADLTKAQVSFEAFWIYMETDDVGQGNPGGSPHGVKDNPNLVEARGRGVHINGHWF